MNVECKNQDAIDDDIELFDDSLLAEFDNSAFKGKAPSTSNIQKTIANKSADLDTSELNVSALCCDEELSGYDKLSGKKWMYPINYPVRNYQFNIIQAAIVKNTLVSLPTGLGKTFIAAVLMYNFYRWYPLGKIIFTAPTRPLIAQQIEACYNIIAMPPDDTIEMTGGMSVTLRQEKWQTKRVFFATPQVVYNDIKSGICPAKKIRCLVFDEAHKAKSNYAYCQIVSVLTEMEHRTYRILGLSATPGSRINDVVQVVKNLHIAHLELRTEGCIDVAPYCHSRDIKIVVIPLGPELVKLRDAYIEVMDFYARRLKQMNILKANLGNLSKGRILMIYKGFQSNKQSHPQRGSVMKDLSQLISLYHGLEQLMYHGARAFLSFFDEQSFADKSWMQTDDRLTALLERLRDDLGVNPLSVDPSTSVPSNLNFGHPKFEKVKEIIENHFKTAKADTRAIVYCEFHETVKLVHCLLSQCGAPIRPRKFVGQGTAGKKGRVAMPQREQLHVMEQFRTGACNVLVSTCVGEEGLDVGSVDLILCFDVATGSPVRLVQRCGRTGRARSGRVYILATEGKEHQTLLDAMRQRDSLRPKILQSREVQESLYKLNPRLIPYDFTPKCEKIYIKVRKLPAKETRKTIGGNKQGNNIKDKKKRQTLHNIPSVSNVTNTNSTTSSTVKDDNHSIMSRLQQTSEVTNSPRKQQNIASRLISSFLSPKKEDMKETKIPTLPSQSTNSLSPLKKLQKDKSKQPLGKSNKKNVDIRALFLTANKPNQKRAELVNELKGETAEMPTHLLDLFIHLKIACETPKICYLCKNGCDCLKLQKLTSNTQENYKNIENFKDVPIFPDINLIKSFNADLLLQCRKPKTETETVPVLNAQEEVIILDSQEDPYFLDQWHDNDVYKGCIKNEADITLHSSHNFDIDDPVMCIKPKRETAPVLSAQGDIINLDTQEDSCFLEQWHDNDVNKGCVENEADITLHNSHNFDIGDPDDIFAMSPPLQENKNANQNIEVCSDIILPQSSVNFDLGSFDDILDASFETETEKKVENQCQIEEGNNKNQTCAENITIDLSHDDEFEPKEKYVPPPSKSPSILSGTRNRAFKSPILTTQKSPILTSQKSPILTTQKRSLKLKRRSHSTTPQSTAKKKLNLGSHDMSNSMLSITQTLDLINDESVTSTTQRQDERRRSPILLTQSERSKRKSVANMIESIIIDDDDDDSDSIPNNSHFRNSTSSVPNKRKIEDDIIASPYFNKKIKLDDQNQKANKTFKDKILAVLTSNDFNDSKRFPNDIINLNCKTSMPLLSPEILKTEKHITEENKLDPHGLASKFSFCPKKSQQDKHELKENRNQVASEISLPIRKSPQVTKPTPSHRTPKKKKPKSDFIDLEAELSGDECTGSGDELSDDSVGSIIDFITDKDVTHTEEDMQAHYLKSVKSPLKLGAFKIPELPKKFQNSILSQFVEPDSYELDSFCVDSHIELTQSNDLTNLELAEMVLENERRQKKKLRSKKYAQSQNELYSPKISATQEDSPKIKRKNGKKYYVMSDSDDSS